MYFYGVGKGKDLDKAMKWCSSAASDERAGAVWKSDFLAITHPETRTAVHMQEWEYGGKTHEIPGKVGGIIPDPSTWNCKSIFVPEEIRAYPPKLENREAQ